MDVYRVKTGSILPLGKQGENLARNIQFDLTRWISTFGPGTVQLLHQRSGDEAPYPVAVEQDGDCAVWTVTNADTAAAGTGRAELQYYVGDALVKSETWMTKVLPALGPASETPPEAQQGWVDQVLAQVAKITGMTAQAVELPAGSAPTADYADGVLTIGIPLGGDVSEAQIAKAVAEYLSRNPITETDPTVPDWAKHPEKPSYTADEVGALSSETLPEAITTALAQAKESGEFDGAAGQDGAPGQDGITPTIGDNGNWYLGDTDTGKPSRGETGQAGADGRDGADGQPGADGKSAYQYAVDGGYTGTEEAFAAKLSKEMPDKLPNPNALTFTGAVTGSYDGSAPLEVEIPSGGGGGNPLYVKDGTTLAEGTIPSGLAQYTFTDTGLKLYEVLQEWKIFFIQVYCAGEVNNINIHTYRNNSQPFYNHGKDCNYALSIFEGVTKDSVKFMFFSAGVGSYWDVYSPAGTISSHNMNPALTLSIKHIPPDTGLYLRNYSKDTGHDYLWKVTGLVKWG